MFDGRQHKRQSTCVEINLEPKQVYAEGEPDGQQVLLTGSGC